MARLVALGDSLTQGFRSFAITDTDLSTPALIAECMGLTPSEFRLPDFSGKGGLPFNIEWIARELERRYGEDLSLFNWARSVVDLTRLADEVEDFWERGAGAEPGEDVLYHNLAVWGFEVGDAYNLSAELARRRMGPTRDSLFAVPSSARLRTAARVLNPARVAARDQDTQLRVAERIQQRDGAIDHLIVAYGANNCLGTVVELGIRETGPEPPGPLSGFTLWSQEAFEKEYDGLAGRVMALMAKHVYVTTVPHVTIPPITRGIMRDGGRLPPDRKYFDFYARFLVPDEDFDPHRHKHLTRADAEHIDARIDAYNDVIRETARRNGWHPVDVCDVLDRLAVRRNHGAPTYPLPEPIQDLSILFFDRGGAVQQGGLISLDGVHPTVCGYGVMALEFVKVMQEFEPGLREPDFVEIRRRDTLVSQPPRTLDDLLGALRFLEGRFNLGGILEKLGRIGGAR